MSRTKAIYRLALPAGLFLFALAALAGCEQRRAQAVVLAKEFIAARLNESTPTNSPAATDSALEEKEEDEIVIDGYVLRPDVRGTGQDPRAQAHPQWLVKVQTTDSGRVLNVPVDEERFAGIKIGDRVRVRYREGKYTTSVWSAELE